MPYLMEDGRGALTPAVLSESTEELGRWVVTAPSPKVVANPRSRATWANDVTYRAGSVKEARSKLMHRRHDARQKAAADRRERVLARARGRADEAEERAKWERSLREDWHAFLSPNAARAAAVEVAMQSERRRQEARKRRGPSARGLARRAIPPGRPR